MCGRYSVSTPVEQVADHFNAALPEVEVPPTYNAAPSQNLMVIPNKQEARQINLFRWGLIPFWAKDTNIGYKMINARAETLIEKPAFKTAFKKRRCLIIADGFYEWQKTKSGKVPHRICDESEKPFAFAGLWEQWHDKANESTIESFTIVTTEANEAVKPLHERMPVILPEDNYDAWLNNDLSLDDQITLLQPYPYDLKVYPVSKKVNSPANNDPSLLKPADTGGELL